MGFINQEWKRKLLLMDWRILKLLVKKELLSHYSIKDLMIHLAQIKKIKIDDKWYLAEVTEKTKKLFSQLDYAIS